MNGEWTIKHLIKILPDNWLLAINEYSLDELDKRKLIFWVQKDGEQ